MREFRLAFDWAEKILARNVAWISVADAKVGPTLTMCTAMLGVLVALVRGAAAWSGPTLVVAAVTAAMLGTALIALALAAFPRIDARGEPSLILFEHVSRLPRDEYVRRLREVSDEDLYLDAARLIHGSSRIAHAKHQCVRLAMALVFASVPPWLLTIALLYGAPH
jgi:hypothetical protein